TPGKLFKEIAPQESLKHKIVSRAINNVTDYGVGFYIVYDSVPNQPVVLDYQIGSEIDYGQDEKNLALSRFHQNEAVRESAPENIPPVLPTPYRFVRGEGVFEI